MTPDAALFYIRSHAAAVHPRTLAQWPWVVVRIDCTFCGRRGCYRLARLAARYGPEQDLAGLLRELASSCPWYNEQARKYEPQCGARFVDLERSLPPPDHPDEPAYRQRQPGREDIPKPKVADRFPASYQGGAPTLSNWPGAKMVLVCETCGRREVFVVVDLRVRFGPDMLLTNARVALSADCPRRIAASFYDQCGALLMAPGEA